MPRFPHSPTPRHRTALAALVAAVATAGLAAAPALSAPKDEIRAKQVQAEQARAAAEQLGMELEPIINTLNEAVSKREEIAYRIRLNTRKIEVTRSNRTVAKKLLEERLVAAYRLGEPDPIEIALSSGSVGELIEGVDIKRRSENQVVNLLADLAKADRTLTATERALERDEATQKQLVATIADQKAEVERRIAEQKQLAVGLEQEIAQLEEEERQRQEALRREAERRLEIARRAAAAAAAQNPDPGVGGSAGGGGGSPTPVSLPPADGSIGSTVVAAAMQWLGTPYSWGGGTASGPSMGFGRGAGTVGFDCSGLTLYAYAQVGISLGHYTGSQWNAGAHISSIADLAPGDLVFFGASLGHMGLYIGGGQMVHAPHTGDVVKISDITSGYYASAFAGGVRPY